MTETAQLRKAWQMADVVDVRDSAFAVRTYLEQTEVRRYLERAAREIPLASAADIGAGYGRLSQVLAERAAVTGFEREPHFVAEATPLLPHIRFVNVPALTSLPVADAAFDFVLTFTVLQHLTNAVVREVVGEIQRIARSPAFVLLCEETDTEHLWGDLEDPSGMCTIGRSVAEYERLLAPFRLVETSPRRIEPTYPRPDVGTYMLFRAG